MLERYRIHYTMPGSTVKGRLVNTETVTAAIKEVGIERASQVKGLQGLTSGEMAVDCV